MARMNILSKAEQELFENPPLLKISDLEVPSIIQKKIDSLRKNSSKTGYLLTYIYFKKTKKFFNIERYKKDDILLASKKNAINTSEVSVFKYEPRNKQRHHHEILIHYGYRGFDKEGEEKLIEFIAGMVTKQVKPKIIFWESVDWLIANRIVVPSYFQLVEVILKSLKVHKEKLVATIQTEMTDEIKSLIDGLFEKEGEYRVSPYRLTLLKKFSQSTKPTQVKERSGECLLNCVRLID